QPVQLWLLAANRAMLALATGRVDEASALMADALPLGERAQPEHAIPHDRLQRYTLAYFRRDVAGHEPALRYLAAAWPAGSRLSLRSCPRPGPERAAERGEEAGRQPRSERLRRASLRPGVALRHGLAG